MSLNIDQKMAVDSRSHKILTLAGPGAGKTFTMLQRISSLIDEGRDPKSFLVLTFTNAAAFEMKERYKKLHPQEFYIPEFKTFHAFCYSVLCKTKAVRTKLGYTQIPTIISDYDEKKLKNEAAQLINCKLTKKQIAGMESISPREQFQYDCLMKALDDMMYERNLITFDKLCTSVCELFVNKDECVQKYASRYLNIFVDEFQDTDERQWNFVQSFENADWFLVADALQAIYGFRGADSTIVKRVSNDKEFQVIKLHENYRSTHPICSYINQVSTYADNSYRILISSKKAGPDVDIEYVDTYSWRGSVSSDALSTMLDKLLDYKDLGTTAILARTNNEVNCISEYLNGLGIEHVVGKPNTRAINILKSIFDDDYLYNWLVSTLPDAQYPRYLRLQAVKENNSQDYTFDDFLHDFANNYQISETMKMIKGVRQALAEGEQFEKNPEAILKEVKQIMRLRKTIPVPTSSDSAIIVASMLASLDSKEEGSIYVGTIHSSKGLEYDSVIVMGANSSSFQLTTEDNKNLYYVAISRAKTNLFILEEV